MSEIDWKSQQCAMVSRMQNEDPVASATLHMRYMLIEVPMPWPEAAHQAENFPGDVLPVLRDHAKAGRVARLLTFECEYKRSPEGYTRLFYMKHPGYPCARFEQACYVVPTEKAAQLADALLSMETGDERIKEYVTWREAETSGRRDLFVCVHGSHDDCCGRLGYPAYQYVQEKYGDREDVRVWCVSHFGGHRHAPTLIEFPYGRYWAGMNQEQLDALVHRNGDTAELYRHYRGWGMIDRAQQAVERELFVAAGWEWGDYVKQGSHEIRSAEETLVRIEYAPDASLPLSHYEAVVQTIEPLMMAGCGYDPEDAKQYRVVGEPAAPKFVRK